VPNPRRVSRALPLRPLAFALAALGLAACASEPTPTPEPDPTSARRPPAGPVVGVTGVYGSHVWRGLPYAAPPVGQRRWRAPAPLEPWTQPRAALRPGSPCAQTASPFAGVVDREPGTFAGSEDCLTLDVYAPRMAPDALPGPDARLPVMVWIHGGGNVVGHAGFYDGGNLAQQRDVVVVMIQYRLGPLGFFRHAALRGATDDPAEASGNFALLDQIRALEWVRENIAAFGGDPGNVTIFGESAGARDVLALLLSPRAEGLFHRALAQSGAVRHTPPHEGEALRDAEPPGHRNSSGEILLRHLVRSGDAAHRAEARRTLAAMEPERVAALLRALPPEALIALYETEDTEGLADVPQVFADGHVLPDALPLERFARPDGWNRVPVLLGTNRDEDKIFLFASPERVRRVLWILPRLRNPARYHARAEVAAAAWKVTGADAPAAAMVRGGWKDVFVYRWDWDEEPTLLGADLSRMIGAAHAFEIPFVFGHWDLGPQAEVVWTEENLPGRRELSAAMMSWWSEFARRGDPGRGGDGALPAWTRFGSDDPERGPMMVLDTSAGGGPRLLPESVDPEAVMALFDANAEALGPEGRCDTALHLAERFRGISDVADARAAACVHDAGAAGAH